MNTIYRQGDVLVVRLDSEPAVGPRVERDAGRIVLAYGEVTGHAHAIKAKSATLYELPVDKSRGADDVWLAAQRFLIVKRAVDLSHEEHATIHIPPGHYKVIRQREYSPEEVRNVAD